MQTVSIGIVIVLISSSYQYADARAKAKARYGENAYMYADAQQMGQSVSYADQYPPDYVDQSGYQDSQQMSSEGQPAYQQYVQQPAENYERAPQQPAENYARAPQMTTARAGPSFLGMSSAATNMQTISTQQTLAALTQAVQQQSQALMQLESQQAQLQAHEVEFETEQGELMYKILSRTGAPKCKGFSKNDAPEVVDEDTCDTACSKAEGYPASGNRYKKVEEGASCTCCKKDNRKSCKDARTLCTDYGSRTVASISSLLAIFLVFLRL